ncbi:hypothetical protein Pan54_38040 [Rubinisphaera italica]|uniref:Uncharacterized protein n=1 Tax=Rubinisphaera italica TaxID=2527969 RepID=A0A5C5XKY1_9PLAN|nr:hypothetical protein Pan54_38040 [Rubinisphaera italica]
MIYRVPLMICLCLAIICMNAFYSKGREISAKPKNTEKVEVIVLEYCRRISSIRKDYKAEPVNSSKTVPDALQEHWSKVLSEGYPLFRNMMQEMEGNEDAAMKIYIREMMNSTSQDSIRLLMASEDIVMPLANFAPYDNNRDKQNRIAYRFQIAAAKVELEFIKSNPNLLAEIYRIAAWRSVFLTRQDRLIRSGTFSYRELVYGEQAESKYHFYDTDAYLWYLRNFLLLCVATGREDLIPENLSEPTKQNANLMTLWEMWFIVHRSDLISSPGGCCWKLIDSPLLSPRNGNSKPEDADKDLPALNHLPLTPFKNWQGVFPVQPVAEHPLCT